MKKKTYTNSTIDILMQKAEDFIGAKGFNGVITKNEDGTLRFEEEIREGRPPRNPKLYDGPKVSLVRQRDGRYALSLKKIDLSEDFEPSDLAFKIYSDVTTALSIIKL